MEFLKSHKNIVIGIVVVLVLFIGYSFVKPDASDPTTPTVSSSVAAPTGDLTASRDIIALLVDLRAIKIQPDFFSDPALRSLEDFSVPLVDEPRGRANPFAPIGVESTGIATTTKTTGFGQ